MTDISDQVIEFDQDGDGVGDFIIRSGKLGEVARIRAADGSGSGWEHVLGGSISALASTTYGLVNAQALQPFWGGLAVCPVSPCDILVIGDSRTEGTEGTGTPSVEQRWASQLRDFLRQQYQVPYGGPVGGRGYVPAWYAISPIPTADQPTLAGAAAANFNQGLGRRNVQSTALADTITWPAITCTSADVICHNLTSGTKFTGKFNADAATQFTTTASGGARAFRVTPGGGRGSNTLQAAWFTGSAANAQLPGAMFYDGDESAGIRLWDSSHHGFLCTDFTGFSTWTSAISNIIAANLRLVTYAFGTNEAGTGISSAQFAVNLLALINQVRVIAPSATTSHLIVMQPPRKAAQITSGEPWANYVAAAKALAVADSTIAFIDLTLSAPTADSDVIGFFGADGTHEIRKGYRMEALTIAQAISPR